MINGAHAILYSHDADATRATLAKVLDPEGRRGWRLADLRPAAGRARRPPGRRGRAEFHLTTDDVTATVTALQAEVSISPRPISDQGWGLLTAISLSGGVEVSLYQPRHPTTAQPTRARSALGVASAQFLELAAVFWLAGLLLDLLDQLLALGAPREVLDELGELCHGSSSGGSCPACQPKVSPTLAGRSHRATAVMTVDRMWGYSPSRGPRYPTQPQTQIRRRRPSGSDAHHGTAFVEVYVSVPLTRNWATGRSCPGRGGSGCGRCEWAASSRCRSRTAN
jgi:hypothetical protein